MNKDVEQLLSLLEPEIDKKCLELKRKRKKEIHYIILLCSILILPSIFFILNISIIYFILMIVIISGLKLFIKLPDILKLDLKGVCYE